MTDVEFARKNIKNLCSYWAYILNEDNIIDTVPEIPKRVFFSDTGVLNYLQSYNLPDRYFKRVYDKAYDTYCRVRGEDTDFDEEINCDEWEEDFRDSVLYYVEG